MEAPQYSLGISLRRILVPRAFMLFVLGIFLYLGIWVNLVVLNVSFSAEYHLIIILGIIVLILTEGILNYLRYSGYMYYFYTDRVIFRGKREEEILYTQIQDIEFKKDKLDIIFNTGTIKLSPVHTMRYIGNTNQVFFYIQKLVQYSQQAVKIYAQRQQQQQQYAQQRYQSYYEQQVK